MPTNLTIAYNHLLDLLYNSERENLISFRRVFDRDIAANPNFEMEGRQIHPTTIEGQDKMDVLFRHLTTVVVDEATRKRAFESERSIRIHWIKYHIENKNDFLTFNVPDEKRTYILNRAEKYVIVFENLRNQQDFYLLTAYHLQSGTFKAIMKKFEKRGIEGLP
ncbi:hypothetical protein HGH92_10620 [Chitinophaga varians]|uniref:Uncharacterized protein n=1 Tax=Chitinophaga varians TaxID=2202339 RepID=A0A847RV45_9BACT|nr:hypothetical protein [Chitinophaga varians]NLR64758.1 hypothetical protein [Chitinophaga varians]